MKKSRPRIKFAQIPHSIARFIETISNPTASSLLSLLTRKTVGFGQGHIDLSYRDLAKATNVGTRAIAKAAKILENLGAIIRERSVGGIYRWKVVLDQDEVIADPAHLYTTRQNNSGGVMIDPSGGCGTIDHDPHERSIMTPPEKTEQANFDIIKPKATKTEQDQVPLKILIKDKDLKKQQQRTNQSSPNASTAKGPLQSSIQQTDDEPLHKLCLKGLLKYGISQRIARKLCREHNHELILSVLQTAPQRPGIQNLAAYIVSEIQDGGYEQTPKTGHQVSGGQSSSARPKTVKTTPPIDAPIAYKSVEETLSEQKELEAKKIEQEINYKNHSLQLASRFKTLSDDLQFRLKLIASVYLSKLVPTSGKRERMLKDKTFKKMANRTVLEEFFDWVDQGLDEVEALQKLESKAAA